MQKATTNTQTRRKGPLWNYQDTYPIFTGLRRQCCHRIKTKTKNEPHTKLSISTAHQQCNNTIHFHTSVLYTLGVI